LTTWEPILGGGVVALVGKIVYDWLSNGKKRRHAVDSGGQDVSFWMGEFQDIKDKVQVVKEAVAKGDIDRATIEASIEAVQHTVDRIEQKINSRRK
jgi:hypothetical protein